MAQISLRIITSREIDDILRLRKDSIPEGATQPDLEFFKEALRQFLDLKPSHPFEEFLKDNDEPRPIWTILTIIRERYQGFALCEEPYLDLEFWDSHTGFYGTCFSSKQRECKRFHFFQGDESLAAKALKILVAGGTEKDVEELGLTYCGYSVFRPIASNVVGRTAIRFDERSTDALRQDNLGELEEREGKPLLKAKQTCSAMLFNAKFTFESAEFIQQDPQLGQCATASLWVAGNIAAKKFGNRQVRFTSITKEAIGQRLPNIPSAYASVDPNLGLSAAEIKNALAAMGAMYQSVRDKKEAGVAKETAVRLSHFVYSYVESGIPAILCLDPKGNTATGHAVAAVGHFLPSKVDPSTIVTLNDITGNEDHKNHAVVSSFIDSYYVHDDCNGPFNSAYFTLSREEKGRAIGIKLSSDEEEGGDGNGYNLREVIVPVHFRVRHNAWDSLLYAIDEFTDQGLDVGNALFLWRSFLISGADFKRSLGVEQRNFSSTLRGFYAQVHMPKYIWVHEFTHTNAKNIHKCFPGGGGSRHIDGEFIVDATTAKNDMSLISARIGAKVWADTKVVKDSNSGPLPCFEHRHLQEKKPEKEAVKPSA